MCPLRTFSQTLSNQILCAETSFEVDDSALDKVLLNRSLHAVRICIKPVEKEPKDRDRAHASIGDCHCAARPLRKRFCGEFLDSIWLVFARAIKI